MSKLTYFLIFSSFQICIYSKYSFLFSVIIPTYNTGKYLNDSINSLLNQTIGFKNIQIIIVNDGSIDETKKICSEYKKVYQKNIVYIEIQHSGVGRARNIGLEQANGKFINFLDPDDFWNSNSFEIAYNYFKNYTNLDVVCGRLKFFEARDDFHPLDYKFKKSHIANLINEYDSIQLSCPSCFLRHSAINGKKFNEELIVGEDALFINILFLEKPFIGLENRIIYNYRKRFGHTSAIQTSIYNDSYYFNTTNYFYQHLFDLSKNIYNKILPFAQYLVAYEILFRLNTPAYKYLPKQKYFQYISILEGLLVQIDDYYILKQRSIKTVLKFLALSLKYNKDLRDDIILENSTFKYNNYSIIDATQEKNIILLKFLNIKDGILRFEAQDNFMLKREKYTYFCKINNEIYHPKFEDYYYYGINSLFGNIINGRIMLFDISIDSIKDNVIHFYISYEENVVEIFPSLGKFTHIPPIETGYYISDGFIIAYENSRLIIYKETVDNIAIFENRYRNKLRSLGKEYLIPLREKAQVYNKNRGEKEIWFIYDKPNQAGDNGEYFFRYLRKKGYKGLEVYFIINQNCSAYKRLKPLGNIIPLNSEKYRELYLKITKIIFSYSNEWIINPFGKDQKFLLDLFHYDYIFIPNEIIKDDYSESFHRHIKNFRIFITSGKKEYNDVLRPEYGYNRNIVKLTGFPKYDGLEYLRKTMDVEKLILIIPIWRKNIKGTVLPGNYEYAYDELFKYTDYFNFYNKLINDKRLLESMEKYNYKGIFSLHYCFSNQSKDFEKNSMFKIVFIDDYQEILAKASLLVTDYSNIFFDFSFLKKPVIYIYRRWIWPYMWRL